jgi:hypothetical protein
VTEVPQEWVEVNIVPYAPDQPERLDDQIDLVTENPDD